MINRTLYLNKDTLATINTPFTTEVASNLFISPNTEDQILSVSVNTMQKSFTILGSNDIRRISLFDISGRVVRIYQTDRTCSLKGVSNGLYIVLIEANNNAVTWKILVQ